MYHEFGGDVAATQTADFNAVCLAAFNTSCAGTIFDGAALTSSLSTSRVGTYGQFGLGVAGQIIDTGWLGYARVDYRTGENIEGVSGNIGLRYQFTPPMALGGLKGDSGPSLVYAPYNWTGLLCGWFRRRVVGR